MVRTCHRHGGREGERDNTVVTHAEHVHILAWDATMAQDPLRGQNNALRCCMVWQLWLSAHRELQPKDIQNKDQFVHRTIQVKQTHQRIISARLRLDRPISWFFSSVMQCATGTFEWIPMVSRRQRLNSLPPYRTIVSLRPRSRDSRLCCSGKSTGLILFYISICPYRQISIYLHIYISLLIPLILCGFSRGMASRSMEEPKSWQIGRSKVFLLLVGTVDFGWGKGAVFRVLWGLSEVCQFCSLEALQWFLCIPGRRRCKQGSRRPLARLWRRCGCQLSKLRLEMDC